MFALDDDLAFAGEPAADAALHIRLLGGFRAERLDLDQPITDWKRQSAKTLTKLLAELRERKGGQAATGGWGAYALTSKLPNL